MSTYIIGDIHGCYNSLKTMLTKISFNPIRDTLWLTGDLVSKGPMSLEVLHLVYEMRTSVRLILGNHDLHLLAVYAGIINNNPRNNVTAILKSSDADKLMNWLRHQPILQIDEEKKIIMTHAGINPKWDINIIKKNAKEIESILVSDDCKLLLEAIYNKASKNYNLKFKNINLFKIQYNINVFTRMRYCYQTGKIEMKHKDVPEKSPKLLRPWFSFPRSIPSDYTIIFGHWSSLMGKGTPPGVYGLDSGCYRGGKLTLLNWENKKLIHVSCKTF